MILEAGPEGLKSGTSKQFFYFTGIQVSVQQKDMIKYCKYTNFRIGGDPDLERQRGTWKKKNVEFSCSEELPVMFGRLRASSVACRLKSSTVGA